MNKSLGIIPFVLSITVSILVIFGSCFSQITKVFHPAENVALNTGAYPLKEKLNIPAKKPQSASVETKKETASVQVNAQKGDAVGKIYEQFLSPYSQKLNYSGIYIKNSTGESLNIKNELSSALELKIKKSKEPEVLIVHTHATESYMNENRAYYTAQDKPRNEDNNKNVVKVGETFAEVLRKGGISVLHDKTHHDSPSYNQSYSRAKTTINEYLSKYPSIKVVVDIHRDSIAMTGNDKCKPTAEINGKKAAQVMLVVGSQTGTVSGFPDWKQNLRLALRFQQTMEATHPGLARAMLFCSRKYNMNLTKGSMLLEVGTDANTLEEAVYSAELAGDALLSVLNTLK